MAPHRRNTLLLALALAAAAWLGTGHSSEDEFSMVIPVAEHLRGRADAASLPMDVQAHWRSMLLPAIAAGAFEAAGLLGVRDPFALALLLRLLTAALALAVLRRLARAVAPVPDAPLRRGLDALNWALWPVPVLLVRFGGEAWSGLLFAQGLALLLEGRPRRAWAIGAWWGAAVLVRPAAAVLPAAAWIWAAAVRREPRGRLLGMIAGGLAALAAGAALDSLCYGTPALPLANYLEAALTGQEAARFTALPWHQYGLFIIKYATPPVGLLLLAALALLAALRPRHALPWVLIAFLAAHSLVPVKEPRFLIPLVPLLPWLLAAAWDAARARWPAMQGRRPWLLALLLPVAAADLLALAVGIAAPAGNGRIRLAQEIQARYGAAPVRIDQLGDWRQWIPPFYLAPGSHERFITEPPAAPQAPVHLVAAPESAGLDRLPQLERLASAAPPWTHRFLRWYGLEDGYDPLVLYRVKDRP